MRTWKKKWYAFKGEKEVAKVLIGSMVVMMGVRKHGMYAFDGAIIYGSAFIAKSTVYFKTELWHKRLGHVSEKWVCGEGQAMLVKKW